MSRTIRSFSPTLAAVSLVAVLAGCSGGAPAGAPTTSAPAADASNAVVTDSAPSTEAAAALEPVADGVLQTCLTGDYRPFSYDDPASGKLEGIDVAMAEALAAKLTEQTGSEVKVEFVKTSWKELMPTFLSSCDIAVGGITVTDERKEKVAFSTPVIHGGKAAITTCGNEDEFDTLEEINQPDTTVITPVGGTNEKFADANFAEADIIRYEDNNAIFDQIVNGTADVMVTDAPEVVWAAHEHQELCQVNADEPFVSQELAYMLPKDDAAFQEAVNAWLDESFQDGTWDAAVKDWFGEGSVFAAANRPD